MQNSLVSICCTAYNHAKFISDCLDGFLLQKTNFNFEVLIHDDASTDGTQDIIKAYQAKYPNIIKPIFQTENQYSKGVKPFIKYLSPASQGKYIALCEGDDYWTDPLKLQKQVDYMESHSECVLTYHGWRNKTIDGKLDPIKGSTMLLTLMFRNVIDKFPREFYQAPNGDSFLRTMLKLKGTFNFIDGISPSVRRVHEGGLMSMVPREIKLDRQAKTHLAIYNAFKDSKLSKELYYKKNIFVFRKMLFDWEAGEVSLVKLIHYPIQVKHLKLYILFFKTILGIPV
jgi:glycosyltransferase involved in cell wall biosynthesis